VANNSNVRGNAVLHNQQHVSQDGHAGLQVLKTTVSLDDPSMPGWSELANDIVVNEKTVRYADSRTLPAIAVFGRRVQRLATMLIPAGVRVSPTLSDVSREPPTPLTHAYVCSVAVSDLCLLTTSMLCVCRS
jgi:hypothetical protein